MIQLGLGDSKIWHSWFKYRYSDFKLGTYVCRNGPPPRAPNALKMSCSQFLKSPRGVAVSNHRYLSSNETRVKAGIRGWKLHLSESAWCQNKSVGYICFTNKWRWAAYLNPWHFQTTALMQLLAWWFFLEGGLNIGVFWKRKSRPIKWGHCRVFAYDFFLHICYNLWQRVRIPGLQ